MADPSDGLIVQCPSCSRRFPVDADRVGLYAQCACGHSFPVRQDSAPPPVPAVDLGMCSQHTTVPATCKCSKCGLPLCDVCAFPTDQGMLCSSCWASGAPVSVPAAIPRAVVAVPEGTMCRQHPASQAVRFCDKCKTPMCATCDFTFPGDIHLCPTCATSRDAVLTPKRKGLMAGAYALAIWGTVGFALVLLGAFAEMGEEEAGIIVGVFLIIPSLIGAGLGLACLDKRLGNPPVVWVAAIWSTLILVAWLLLSLIGNLMMM